MLFVNGLTVHLIVRILCTNNGYSDMPEPKVCDYIPLYLHFITGGLPVAAQIFAGFAAER